MKEISYKNFSFIIPVIILLIIQVPNLGLPYFWDEAWSYIPSIVKMKQAGPSLLPGVIPIDYCKGHPQFFFFISSLWMKLFSENIVIMRLLPLLFSIGTIVTIYFGLLKLANWESAFIASLLVSVQSLFLAQSIFLLPEMLMTLLFVLSFFFLLNNRFLAYAISSTLMVLTKETSIIFALIFGLYYLLSLFVKSNRETFRHRYLVALMMPVMMYVLFLILHYIAFKQIFYGDHVGYISLDWPTVHDKIFGASEYIFIGYGRRYVCIAAVLGLLIWLFQRSKNASILILGILSILAFLAFSSVNFYTQRYSLVMMVIFILLTGYILGQVRIHQYIKALVTLVLASVCLYFSLTEKQNGDVDLGYVQTIKVHQQLVQFCQENNLYDVPLSVTFNMIFILKDKDLGYVKGPENFTKVMGWNEYMQAKYYIYEITMGNNPTLDYAKQNFKLIKTISLEHAWGSIYENTHYQDTMARATP